MHAKYHRFYTDINTIPLLPIRKKKFLKLKEVGPDFVEERLKSILMLREVVKTNYPGGDSNEDMLTTKKNLQTWKCDNCKRHNLDVSKSCVQCLSDKTSSHNWVVTQKQDSSSLPDAKGDHVMCVRTHTRTRVTAPIKVNAVSL